MKIEFRGGCEGVGAEVAKDGGMVLIPAFSVGRAQQVIFILRSAISRKQLPALQIYVDGMVKDINTLYRLHPGALRQDLARRIWREKDVFYSDSVQSVSSAAMRQEIVGTADPCCIMSSSGMLSGGPSCFHVRKLAGNDRNFITITGYQDEEAPGRRLFDMLEMLERD